MSETSLLESYPQFVCDVWEIIKYYLAGCRLDGGSDNMIWHLVISATADG